MVLTKNNDIVETVNENSYANFNVILHYNVQCVAANDVNKGLCNAAEYLMNDAKKEFIKEC